MSISTKNQPFLGESFYLDLPDNKNTQFLIRTIKKLGGVIESFLSKEVTYVVSNSKFRKRRTARHPELQHSPSCRETRTNLLSLGILKDSSSVQQQQKSTENHTLISRGKELLQKAIRNQDGSGGSSILVNAHSWGVRILHVGELMDFIKQLSLEARNSSSQKKFEKYRGSGVRSVKVLKLKSPFLKIEDTSRLFRPLNHRFQCFPELNYLAPQGVNPYYQASNPHQREKAGDPVDYPIHSEQEEEERSHKPLAPTTPKRKKGFCECCQEAFQELSMHLHGEPHQRFAQDASQYVPVDDLISQFSNCFVELPVASSSSRLLDHSVKTCLAQDSEHEKRHAKDTETALSSELEYWKPHKTKRCEMHECSGPEHSANHAAQLAMAATLGKVNHINQSFPCAWELSCAIDQPEAQGDISLPEILDFAVLEVGKEQRGLCDKELTVSSHSEDKKDLTSKISLPNGTELTRASPMENCSSMLGIAPDHKAKSLNSNELYEIMLPAKKRKRSNSPDLVVRVCDSIKLAGCDATHSYEMWDMERMNTNAPPSVQETRCVLPDHKRLCSSSSSVSTVTTQPISTDHGQDPENGGLSVSNQQKMTVELTANEQDYEMACKRTTFVKGKPVKANLSFMYSTNGTLLGHPFFIGLNANGPVAVQELQNMELKPYADTNFVKGAHFTDQSCLPLPSCTDCNEQELVATDQPRTETLLVTGTSMIVRESFSSESEWDTQVLSRLDQMHSTKEQNLHAEVLRRTCISVQDSSYESHLCSVLKQRSEQDWAGKEKSLTNCRTEIEGIPFTLFDTCFDHYTS
ncbi:protein DBF4 homolog B [Rhinatrema bivittatum]|uniref:protein DBF4 homolog B n=1 Tax=Rhinatrema bivittatum TaxID=194408 RepID=UPI00112BD401|nr:protein DBF4 homolog B [Rhinatrema bivittatum]XP_029429336.1 protein DBF4 homolog B [Rhinatrema bivittatum]XP_029429337.1 protein DBF4 homolog B [Rhinatrema bivittatum]